MKHLSVLFVTLAAVGCSDNGGGASGDDGGDDDGGDDDAVSTSPDASVNYDGVPGEFHETFGDRSYVMYVPPSYSSAEAVPLVTIFYGACKSAEEFYEKDTVQALKTLADTEKFIIVLPDSTVACGDATCRDFIVAPPSCSGIDSGDNIEAQMDGVVALLDDIATHYRIDRTQIHAMGHSNGAYFTGVGGLDHSDYFASLLLVANGWGNGFPYGAPTRKIPTQFVCGEDDPGFCEPAQTSEAYLEISGFQTRIEVIAGEGHSFDGLCEAVGVDNLYAWMHDHPLVVD